jgi:hypothetical protein
VTSRILSSVKALFFKLLEYCLATLLVLSAMLGVTNGSGDVAGSYDPGGLWTPNSARKDVKTKGQSPQAQDNLQVVVATPKATMGPSHYISTLTNVV